MTTGFSAALRFLMGVSVAAPFALRAEEPAPVPVPTPAPAPALATTTLSLREEFTQLDAQLKRINSQIDALPEVAPLRAALDDAEQQVKLVSKETAARLDPGDKSAALRIEAKTATAERQAEIKNILKEQERAVAADPAVTPFILARDAARAAYMEKRKAAAATLAPDLSSLEKRRSELRKQLK